MADRFEPVPPPADEEPKPLAARLLWFAGLALAGIAATAAAAYVLRALLFIG